MGNPTSGKVFGRGINGRQAEDFRYLSHQILECANRGIPKVEFLHEMVKILLEFSDCDSVELWIKESDKYVKCGVQQGQDDTFKYEIGKKVDHDDGTSSSHFSDPDIIEQAIITVTRRKFDGTSPLYTGYGSFWTGDLKRDISSAGFDEKTVRGATRQEESYNSLALIPLMVADDCIGVLKFAGAAKNHFTASEIEHLEITAETIAITLVNESAQTALRERVKELSCLYSMAQVDDRKGISLEGVLKGIAHLLPPAWQYPEITAGRIVLDGRIYSTPGFQTDGQQQHANIAVNGRLRGRVEVAYLEEKPELDEGPFLKEERNLIDAIARQVALIIERREAEEERTKLQEQLRHADRLATLGQLAAGIAHEINEPLGSVLGFAQLLRKDPAIIAQAAEDVSRIEIAALHAREVVKKLMLFGRQAPPQKRGVNLNKLIEEGLYFLKSRANKSGIRIILALDKDIPEIDADQSQIYQVLVNLAVNAMQAMPKGGDLTISTKLEQSYVSLTVADTGIGMDEETRKKVFMPFFTTKDIGEGTGIGLSVVHSIVNSHGGTISVESEVNKGSSFEVQLPLKENPA